MTTDPRVALVAAADRLAARGLSPGSSGNVSVRLGDRVLITPTGLALAGLGPSDLATALVDSDRADEPGPVPSKELPLHRAVYQRRADARAVVHLHAPHSTALSCLPRDAWPERRLPWLTPYQVTKVGALPVVPYALPGSRELADGVGERAAASPCLLLANHGSIAAGSSLTAAVDAAEELEAAAQLMLTLRGLPFTALTDEQTEELLGRL